MQWFLFQEDDQDLDLMSDDVCGELLVSNGEDPEMESFTATTPKHLVCQ